MELATLIGISISEFWDITPFELNLLAKGYAKRKEAEQKESIYQAYLISRWVWQKKIDIEKILEFKKEKKKMTDEEMLEQVKVLNRMLGGSVNTCNN
jgi:hypothetical protein